ncbi:putative retrotransposon hot spot protein (RHS) [Trypanosoma cruzi]|uniref:Putative retrotransposon hot spot protein (RHS) n=1 Tax=Trypanosoma cruzi TaxID=5693 RepID=A0A2V2VBZ0_TRYCR|nr:putative retrotransposon hot spot protein (RHS) [Trypanosoma cruzi]
MHRPQWTMNSSVEDILLEGSTLKNNMKLNEFLRSNFGEEWVVERNGNVTMETFVLRPTMFINDNEILDIITASPSYQLLKRELEIELDNRKRELNERKILLEAIHKLHHEGVYSLRQWRGFKSKNTVTPHAKGKLNAVLTQVQTEEKREAEEKRKVEEKREAEEKRKAEEKREAEEKRKAEKKREAEERVRREEDERQRRAQEMKFTISTNIEDVLFKGRVRDKDMKLNDFLTVRFGGKGVVDTNEDVLLEEFFKEPARYIPDARVLNEIKTTVRYLKMGRAVMEEVDMEEVVRKLHENGVLSLEQWRDYEGKDTVTPLVSGKLNAALSRAQISTSVVKSTVLKGYYESVYNAGWSHLVEVPDSEKEQTEMGMKVKEGKPEQSWTYKKVGDTLERNNGVQQSGEAPPRLMVLTSDKGWPYSWKWKGNEFIRDCYVDCEVERVWRIVEHYLIEWFGTHVEEHFTPERLLLIGTPGIGKSMNAGSYLLYQLLHCDAEKLPVVLYVIGNEAFLF